MSEFRKVYIDSFTKVFGDTKTHQEIEIMVDEYLDKRNQIPMDAKNLMVLFYHKGLIDEKDLELTVKSLENNTNLTFATYDQTGQIIASLDLLQEGLTILISAELLKNILLGSAGSATWDLIKNSISFLSKKIPQKRKIYKNDKVEEVDNNIIIQCMTGNDCNIKFKLPKDIDDNKLNMILDKLFDRTKTEYEIIEQSDKINILDTQKIAMYVSDEEDWDIKNMHERIKEKLKNK